MQYSTTKHVISSVLQWKIRFMQVSTLTWNFRNAVFRLKTRLFVRFTVKNWLCVSANADFKLHERDNLVFFFVKIKTAHVKKIRKNAREKNSGRETIWKFLKKCTWKRKYARENLCKIPPVKTKSMPVKNSTNLPVTRHKFP